MNKKKVFTKIKLADDNYLNVFQFFKRNGSNSKSKS